MAADDRRFVNFPLCLLSETITEPGAGMNRLALYVIADYARHCRPDAASAMVQFAYAVRGGKETPPKSLQRVAGRQAFRECVESIDECWCGSGDDFTETAKDVFGDPAEMFTEDELAGIVEWCSIRRSAHFFGRKVTNCDGLAATVAAVQKMVDGHQERFGAVCMTSVPAPYFFEAVDNAGDMDAMRLLRMVCAVRSLIGTKRFTGTTKDMIRGRMIGGKSPAAAAAMAADSKPLQDELDAMGSRKRFDRLCDLGRDRKFYVKLGKFPFIYFSTQAKTPHEIKSWLDAKKAKREANHEVERQARCGGIAGGIGGDIAGDIGGDIFNKSFQQVRTVRHLNKALKIKGHQSTSCSDVSLVPADSIPTDTEVTL